MAPVCTFLTRIGAPATSERSRCETTPSMEPRSPWASSHGERESIPTIKIELAGFGIGKLLSAEHDLYDREWPFSIPTWNASLRGASIKSSSKDAGTKIGRAHV